MRDRSWWMYSCQIIIFVCTAALFWMLAAYAAGDDSVNMPISSFTAKVMVVCAGMCLLFWLVVRLATGRRGGLVDWLLEIMSWWA